MSLDPDDEPAQDDEAGIEVLDVTVLPQRLLSLDALRPNPKNPKRHDIPTIKASMRRFGYTSPVLVDERTGMLVAGHGRRQALLDIKAAGEPPPQGITATVNGDWLVPVYAGWASENDAEAEAYLVADNRLVETGGWDDPPLASLLDGLRSTPLGLKGLGFTDPYLKELLERTREPVRLQGDPDQVPEIPKAVVTKPGDIWILGGYTVCPDCGHQNPVG